MSDLGLSNEEVEWLTGLKRPSHQRRWLTKNGIRYFERSDGSNFVPRKQPALEGSEDGGTRSRRAEPNLEGLAHGKG